jgi:ubiquinone/menaquinone biosynthesis C-methylase UbiE
MTQGSVVFDRAADYYDRTRGFPPGVEDDAVALVAGAGGFTSRSRVIEVGIGTGRIALPLARHVGAIYGIDLSRPMLDRLVSKQQGKRVYPLMGDATHLPFPDQAFDGAVAVHFFHLVPTWADVLRELARVLRPNAPLVHSWNERDADERFDRVWQYTTGKERGAERGVPFAKKRTFLQESGWTPIGEEQIFRYTIYKAPQQYLDNLRDRLWSRTWTMSDEELNEGVAKVQAYIAENYADPTVPQPVQAGFHVQAYLPPNSN